MNQILIPFAVVYAAYGQLDIVGLENLNNPFKSGDPMCSVELAYKEGRNEAAESHRYQPASSRLIAVGHGCKQEVVTEMKLAFVKGAKDAETMGKVDETVKITLDAATTRKAAESLPTAGKSVALTPTKKPEHGCLKGSNGILCGWNCAKTSVTQIVYCSEKRDHHCFTNDLMGACGTQCKSSNIDGITCI